MGFVSVPMGPCPSPRVRRRNVSVDLWWLVKQEIQPVPEDLPSLELEGLCKSFVRSEKGPNKKRINQTINAVNNLSLTANRGEIFGLLGPNACGKSTTMKCIGTILEPDAGSIRVFGIDVVKQPRIAREMYGYVHQEAGLDKILTGREHLEMFADLAHLDRKTREKNISDLIQVLNMDEFIDLQTGIYSGGIKRRLDIALALLHQPGLLLLDEPTTGLDLESRNVIWRMLRDYRDNGGCILLTSHYLEEVEMLADRVIIMDKGNMIAGGTTSELKESLGGLRVQIRIEEFTPTEIAEEAIQFLRSREEIREGLVNAGLGNALELVVTGDVQASELVEDLKNNGHKDIFSYAQSRMSLGDVYLSATGRTLDDADLSAKARRDPKQTKKEQVI